jgi:hypothetical protein
MLSEAITEGIVLAVASEVLETDGLSENPFSFCAVILTEILSNKMYPTDASIKTFIGTIHFRDYITTRLLPLQFESSNQVVGSIIF